MRPVGTNNGHSDGRPAGWLASDFVFVRRRAYVEAGCGAMLIVYTFFDGGHSALTLSQPVVETRNDDRDV